MQYQKTHGLTNPGEQKLRNYNWPVDKNTHVFGIGETVERDGTKKSLRPDLQENECPITKIGDKRLEDFRQATNDMLGKGKFRGTLGSNIKPDYTFGVKSLKENNWNVGKCIFGDPELLTEKMVSTDSDLGKSFSYRSKNEKLHPSNKEYNRLFGVPSVRTDLKQPKEMRSVCDLKVSHKILLLF